jgi:hypothetical protein
MTSHFTIKMFDTVRQDMETGRLPLSRTTISDDIRSGLRAEVRPHTPHRFFSEHRRNERLVINATTVEAAREIARRHGKGV